MGERTLLMLRQMGLSLLAVGAVLVGPSCGGQDITQPSSASLEVTSSTIGSEPDANGYTVQIDAETTQALAPSGTLRTTDIAPGNHTVQLDGVAANCTVLGENPRSVNIAAGETTTVTFEVTCGATTSSLQVSSTTTGPSPDADGYRISLDGTDQGALGQSDRVTFGSVAPGDHLLGLNGVTGNCRVDGENPRNLTFAAGESSTAAFDVACGLPPKNAGTLQLTTTVTGDDPDPDGYVFLLDGETSQPIGVAASVSLDNVAAESHTVELSRIAENCSVEGSNPRSVMVPAGETVELTFAVTCHITTGMIRVTVATTGTVLDPDGYLAQLDGGETERPVEVNGAVSFTGVAAGQHTVTLGDVTANCSVAGEASRDVAVTPGGSSDQSFVLTCSAGTGSVQVSTTTTGASLDPDGYGITVDGTPAGSIERDGNQTVGGLAPGSHQIALTGLPANCTLEDANQEITVSAGAVSSVAFAIACSPRAHKIAFASDREGSWDIFVMDEDGTNQLRLTDNPESDRDPSWSPDGTRLAYMSVREGNAEIFVMNADGSGLVNLTNDPAFDGRPAWSPDGKKIAFDSDRDTRDGIGMHEIYLMNADGTDPVRLPTNQPRSVNLDPSWSPDGTRIAFASNDFGNTYDIYVIDADGSGLVNVTHGYPAFSTAPAWSPDGRQIAFSRFTDTPTNFDVYVMDPDGSNQKMLTMDPASDGELAGPTWSPDSRRIAFWSSRLGGSDIYVMNSDGTDQTNLTRNASSDDSPAWSP
jgi:Tol biopolymer transport system component